jgi:hypothetical protein
MSEAPRLFGSIVFAAIAIILLFYTWLPARDGLQLGEARITNIVSQTNTWYEVRFTTSEGTRITCRARRDWPLVGPSRCPLDRLERLIGHDVSIMHDGKHPFEVTAGSVVVIDYSAHRRAQMIAFALAGLMLVLVVLAWRRR